MYTIPIEVTLKKKKSKHINTKIKQNTRRVA
jgi:hypothetical protein